MQLVSISQIAKENVTFPYMTYRGMKDKNILIENLLKQFP